MGNIVGSPVAIAGESRQKGLKFIGAEHNNYCGYDEILNLVAESIGDNVSIPGEVMVEILCRLPVKSLIRFKTVCKPWNLLMHCHAFIHKHLHRPTPQRVYAVQREEKEGNIFPVGIDYIMGACNGIVGLSARPNVILFNPATREFSFVPHVPRRWHIAVFCYLPKTQQYQIVFFTFVPRGGLDGPTHVDITTLTLGRLQSLRVAKNISIPGVFSSRQVTCGTTMYWLGLRSDDTKEIIICYDVIEGRFIQMSIPSSSIIEGKCLAVFNGSVIMFVYSWDARPTFFDIWMLIDDMSNGKSWVKYRKLGPLETPVCPLGVCLNDRWMLFFKRKFQYERINDDLVYYDLETDQVEDNCDFLAVEEYMMWENLCGSL